MDSSWIKRLNRRDELQTSKLSISEHVATTTGKCQETEATASDSPESQHCEVKRNNGKTRSKGGSFLDTANTETCNDDAWHVRHNIHSVDLTQESLMNVSLTGRTDLTNPRGSMKEETKMESKEVAIKLITPGKSPSSYARDGTGVPLKPSSGRVLFCRVVGDSAEHAVHSSSTSILLDAPSILEIPTSDEERNKISYNSTLSVTVDDNIYADDCSMHVHGSVEEDNGDRCIKDHHGIKAGNSSFPFTCADLQLKLSPPSSQCSVPKEVNMDLSKDAIKFGNSLKCRLGDTFPISSLSRSTLPETAGPSERTRDMYEQAIMNENMSHVVSSGSDRDVGNSLKLALMTSTNVLYDAHASNQYSQQEGFRIELRSTMPEMVVGQKVVLGHQSSGEKRMHCRDLTEGNFQNMPLIREQDTLPPENLNLPSCHINDEIPAVEMECNDGTNLGDMGVNNSYQISDALSQMRRECVGQVFSNNTSIHKRKLKEEVQGNASFSGLSQETGFSNESSHMQSLLSKRPSMNFENCTSEKRARNTRAMNTTRMWIERWHPKTSSNTKNMQDDNLLCATKISNTVGLKKFKVIDDRNTAEDKGETIAEDQSLKSSEAITSKRFPSVAAMAIVGTAARQFCSTQPQQKGFAFWSGFGMHAAQKFSPGKSNSKSRGL